MDEPRQLDFFKEMGPVHQLIISLNILKDMVPDADDDIGFEEWRQKVKSKMLEQGIDLETLKKTAPIGEVKAVKLEDDGHSIVVYIDGANEKDIPEEQKSLAGFAFLCNWILSDAAAESQPINIEDILPQLRSLNIKKRTFPNNKLTNELQHGIIGDGPTELIVSSTKTPRGKKPTEITTYTIVTDEGNNPDVKLTKSRTGFDREVESAISSYWEYGDKSRMFTPETLYRNMNHRLQSETPSPQQIAAITKSIEKQRRIFVHADASRELRQRGVIGEDESFILDDFLLSITGIDAVASGKKIRAYVIDKEPLMLKYSKMTGQLITVDSSLLDIKKVDSNGNLTTISIANTESRIAIKGYLLRRIEIMREDRKKTAERQRRENYKAKQEKREPMQIRPEQSPTILLDTVFSESGITKPDAKTDARKYIFNVLDFYKAKGRIKAYKKKAQGKAITAVTIEF